MRSVWKRTAIIGIAMILTAAWKFTIITADRIGSRQLYASYEQRYTRTEVSEKQKPASLWYEQKDVDMVSLQKENPDIIGWIFFENEEISYPLLYSGDNETYLYRAANKSHHDAGSLFVEGANALDFEDCHTIIYGHNMRNLSMFGKLRYYRQQPNYYKDHAFFQILTKDHKYRYQIFAYGQVDADSWVYTVPFAPDDTFGQFIQKLYAVSMMDTEVYANQTDKIITLSTCAERGKRFVVHAVRVDEK